MSDQFGDSINLGWLTTKLTLTYLAIIMVMSVSFSFVIFETSIKRFDYNFHIKKKVIQSRAWVVYPFSQKEKNLLRQKFEDNRQDLMFDLIYLNLLNLLAGGLISYWLANKNLRPIRVANQAQNQFISDAAHELKTPLAVLQTTNEVALRKSKLNLQQAKDTIEGNLDEVERLTKLTESLLSFFKVGNTSPTLESVDLSELIADVIAGLDKLAEDNKVNIQNNSPNLLIKTNRDYLKRIMTILLENSIKYSNPETTTTVSVDTTKNQVSIRVRDQGIGIKASDLPFIFRRFYRADKSRTDQNQDGYGLGLSIAQKAAEALGGKIKVKSRIGQGSEFICQIPLSRKSKLQ